jgi:3-phosphoshikimate 1-carboxyvinyltransferase
VSSPVKTIEPLEEPPDAVVTLPGSKSLTNRALVAAALASGTSTLRGVLDADDTVAMRDCLTALGVSIASRGNQTVVEGSDGVITRPHAELDARQSGTTARFLLPLLASGRGRYRIDGDPQLRRRPMADATASLRELGVTVAASGPDERLPIEVTGGPAIGGRVRVQGEVSSQFLSGLLLVGPVLERGVDATVTGALVSRPYVEMTASVMRAFGSSVEERGPDRWIVAPSGYRAATYDIEPDASAASYFFAAAAVTGGRVTVDRLGATSLQGDVAFVKVLARMGATVDQTADSTTVHGSQRLEGVDVDLRDLSDTVPTLAVVAAFAHGPTRIRGVGFIRRKESDRVGAVVAALRALGVDADEERDGLVVRSGPPTKGRVNTHGDHRLAMAFALVGLRVAGVEISDPACVAKTFPGFWTTLEQLRRR